MRAILWIISLSLYEILFSYLIISNKIIMFLHPKMKGFVYFSIIIVFFLILVEIRKLFLKRKNVTLDITVILFIIPLLASSLYIYKSEAKPKDKPVLIDMTKKDNKEVSEKQKSEDELAHLFKQTVENLNENLDANVGRQIELVGFIYVDETMGIDEFLITRLLMNCCAADAIHYGILSNYKDIFDFTAGDWVKVTGVIEKVEKYHKFRKKNMVVPYLRVKKIEKVKAPKSPYIYP